MASSTGIPEQPPDNTAPTSNEANGEMEPLLGRPGDATQADDGLLLRNLILGTGFLAELGVLLLAGLVWSSVLVTRWPPILFSAHPLLQSVAIIAVVQAILVLQPTRTESQKRSGTIAHASFQVTALLLLVAGVVVIETNKAINGLPHFHSVHAILGVVALTLFVAQFLVGVSIWLTPVMVWGSEIRAKKIYRWHRWSGYLILLVLLATVAAATETDYNKSTMHIKLWAVLVLAVLLGTGVFPRVKKQKLGFST